MQRLEDTSTFSSITLAIIGYSLCSSTLLLANKMTMVHLQSPSMVAFIQILFSTFAVLLIKLLGLSNVDWFDLERVKAYALYVFIFVAAIYTNMKALSYSNVETVIVFRSCTPIVVAFTDYLFMNRESPSNRSLVSLILIVIGAIVYCLSDSQLALHGIQAYYWVISYFLLIIIEMTYGKSLTSNVKMNSVWGPVLYCNALSIIPMALICWGNNDFDTIYNDLIQLSTYGLSLLLFSCIVGTLIGYTGWLIRSMVSATTFTLVGVVNKFLTVLLNVLVWDKHSSVLGIISVCICLFSGSFYQQSPRRDESHKSTDITTTSSSSSSSSTNNNNTNTSNILLIDKNIEMVDINNNNNNQLIENNKDDEKLKK